MKRLGILILLLGTSVWSVFGQKELIYPTGTFRGVKVNLPNDVELYDADSCYLAVVSDEEEAFPVQYKIKKGVLDISLVGDDDALVRIYAPVYDFLHFSGAADVKSVGPIQGERLLLKVCGACDADLDVELRHLDMVIGGSSDVVLGGRADTIVAKLSGAADLSAFGTKNIYARITGSGASDIQINTDSTLIANISGASSIKYEMEPAHKDITAAGSGTYKDKTEWVGPNGDEFSVEEGEDTTRIRFNNNELIVVESEHGTQVLRKKNGKLKHKTKPRFRGNWAGLELGVNGYLGGNGTLDLPVEYQFLELNYPKSTNFNLNFFQQSVNLIGHHFGLVTGLGLRWTNYRFYSANMVLVPDSGFISGYYDTRSGLSYSKSKLTSSYLTLPVLLEFQTNRYHHSNSFHIAVGAIGGMRLSTHSKQVYSFNGSGKNKPKVYDNFFLQPFFVDATLRIGWGPINFYATYGLTEMFRLNRGPVLYPFTVGLILPFT